MHFTAIRLSGTTGDCVAHLLGQRQPLLAPHLADDGQPAASPVDLFEVQMGDLARPESEPDEKQNDGAVAYPAPTTVLSVGSKCPPEGFRGGLLADPELGTTQHVCALGRHNVRIGSLASFSRCPRQVRSASNSGKIAALQRIDVEGHFRTRAPQQIRRRVARRDGDGDGEFSTVTILGEIRSDAVLDAAYATRRRSGCGSALMSPRSSHWTNQVRPNEARQAAQPRGSGRKRSGGGGSLSSVQQSRARRPK
jgi:hypothetical protein